MTSTRQSISDAPYPQVSNQSNMSSFVKMARKVCPPPSSSLSSVSEEKFVSSGVFWVLLERETRDGLGHTDTMQRRLVIGPSGEGAEVDVRWSLVGQGRNAHLAEHMQSVGRNSHADLLEIVGLETRQVGIAQVLDGSKIFGLMLYRRRVSSLPLPGVSTTLQVTDGSSLLYSRRRRTRDLLSACSTCLNTLMDSSFGSCGSPSLTVSAVAFGPA